MLYISVVAWQNFGHLLSSEYEHGERKGREGRRESRHVFVRPALTVLLSNCFTLSPSDGILKQVGARSTCSFWGEKHRR